MQAHLQNIAEKCLEGAETNSMAFPEIVKTLIEAGFESYAIDFRARTATYYLPDGNCIQLAMHPNSSKISSEFNVGAVQAAIKEAQQLIKGYTYKHFCEKIMAAGCVGYIVSFIGKRALYLSRSAETHTELFPPLKP